jgi:hypothetical protein
MRLRGLIVIAALALLLAAPASGRLLDVGELPDAAGDGAPDITRVRVGSNATAVTFIVDLANQTTLAGDQGIFIFIDSDLNPATGGIAGFEFVLGMVADGAGLLRWDGAAFVESQSQTAYGYHHQGFRLAVARSDLALTSGTLRFVTVTFPLATRDMAPDASLAEYALSDAALTLQIARFTAAKTVAAGKRYTATLQARRSDLAELSSAGEVVCAAKLGAKKVKVTATFPADRATCSGVVPKTAKGKMLKVTVTLTLDGVRVTRTASIKVK